MSSSNTNTGGSATPGLITSTSGNLREVDVIDIILAQGKHYKPAIVRSYARFSYMPDGKTVLDTIRSVEEEVERLKVRIVTIEEFLTKDYTRAILDLQQRVAKLEKKI